MCKNHKICTSFVLAASVFWTFLALPVLAQDPMLENKGKATTICGYVRDAACLMRHPDVLRPNNDCALMCARAGSPLVIATRRGELYLPISPAIPDQSQREKLLPYVGKYVRVSGRVFERSGLRSIAIKHIEPASEKSR